MKEGSHLTHHTDGRVTNGPWIWCDLCGWGHVIIGDADGTIHFCSRHKADAVRDFWTGKKPGYFSTNRAPT